MSALCPTCGQQIAAPQLLLCLNSNVAARMGKNVRLSPQQAEILHALQAKPGRFQSVAELCVAIYGAGDGPGDEGQTMRSQIADLRKRLAPLGVGIENAFAIGYRLVVFANPRSQATA